MEVSVVMPCLNEERTLGACIEKIREAFKKDRMDGEIIVVDNGSTDKSVEIARSGGARVIIEKTKGYGSALRRGIEAAGGKYIIMGDADNTYDFSEISKFVQPLREGYELVMGSRFAGKILHGAMSWSHRYIGNPLLSGMLNVFFRCRISDAHCGLRSFTKDAFNMIAPHSMGMEFASEMVIHAVKKKLKICEVPITYYPREGESKLNSFSDAWRHIRFMLLYSPNHLFFLPGLILFLVGIILLVRLMFGPIWLFGRNWDIHVMVLSSMVTILGWQILNLGLCGKMYSYYIGLDTTPFTEKLVSLFNLERTVLFGAITSLLGVISTLYIFLIWSAAGFGKLSQVKTALLSLTLIVMGMGTSSPRSW